jgi:hypothetical protein
MLGAKIPVAFTVELLQLSEFFRQSHSRQKRVDSSFVVRLTLLRGIRCDGKDECESQSQNAEFNKPQVAVLNSRLKE